MIAALAIPELTMEIKLVYVYVCLFVFLNMIVETVKYT